VLRNESIAREKALAVLDLLCSREMAKARARWLKQALERSMKPSSPELPVRPVAATAGAVVEQGGISTGRRDASDTNRGGGIVTDSPASAATTSADTRSGEEDGQATESIASNGGEVTAAAATAATTDDGRSDVRKPLGAAVKHEATKSPEILKGKQGEEVVTSAIPSGNRDAPAAVAVAVFKGSTVA
ncbi:unnamed protein product, partial [Ectocarpus sp. 12 AP-2014]